MSRVRRRKSNRGKIAAGLVAAVIILIGVVAVYQMNKPTSDNNNTTGSTQVQFSTSEGNFIVELYDDMPITTTNFKQIVNQGLYNGTTFHRIVTNFIVQGGQISKDWPTISDESKGHSNARGTIAMAKISGDVNSATTEFFINLNDTNVQSLGSEYNVFGHVVSGMDVVDAIGRYGTSDSAGTPTKQITINSVSILAS